MNATDEKICRGIGDKTKVPKKQCICPAAWGDTAVRNSSWSPSLNCECVSRFVAPVNKTSDVRSSAYPSVFPTTYLQVVSKLLARYESI